MKNILANLSSSQNFFNTNWSESLRERLVSIWLGTSNPKKRAYVNLNKKAKNDGYKDSLTDLRRWLRTSFLKIISIGTIDSKKNDLIILIISVSRTETLSDSNLMNQQLKGSELCKIWSESRDWFYWRYRTFTFSTRNFDVFNWT